MTLSACTSLLRTFLASRGGATCDAKANLTIGGLLVAICFAFITPAEGADQADRLATLCASHPRLLFTSEDQQRIEKLAKTDALLARLIQQNHAHATAMLRQEPTRYDIPDGKRLLRQSRKCIARVLAMAMAYRLSGEETFAEGAINEMLIAAKFKDWNPSHFLDTAEMTTALAIGYDWLYDVIEPEDRRAIRESIVSMGLKEGLKYYRTQSRWLNWNNNWNQVCNGGMIIGALAIAEDEKDLAGEIITYALESMPDALNAYQPIGAYPEGPGYWQYGTSYTCLTIDALKTALGHDCDLRETPGLDRTGSFRIQTIGPTGQLFNYADSGSSNEPNSTMFFLSHLYDKPFYASWHRQQLSAYLDSGRQIKNRFFPLEIGRYDPRDKQPATEALPRDALFRGGQDLVVMRSEWGSTNAVYVGFKAGDNRSSHGHLDIGSFVLEAEGVRWAIDLGPDNYNMPGYSGNGRWQYYRLNNRSHNTLVIDDQIQNIRAKCNVIAFHSTPQRTSAVVDMTNAYSGQAKSALRGIEMLDRRAVHVRDELTGAEGQVRWGMVTGAEVALGGRRATLTQDGKTLLAEILAPTDAEFEVLSNTPPTPAEKQNTDTRILAITVTATAKQPVAISVLLQPTDDRQTPLKMVPRGLDHWPHGN